MLRTTNVFDWTLQAYIDGYRYIVNQGGTSSSKTYSTLQLLTMIALKSKHPLLISVMSESLPHLKKGAIKDFESILQMAGLYDEKIINRTDKQYKVGNSTIEFFSADLGKATGPRRDILYLNECNNIPYAVFDAAAIRTAKTIFLDYNPTNEFWVHEKIFTLPKEEYFFRVSTYLDNNHLPDAIKRDIENKRERDPMWWKIYGLGELGSIEGLVFPDFHQVDTLPQGGRSIYGMDFGFSNDPTTFVNIVVQGDNLYLDQHLYQTGMTSSDIINFLKSDNISRTSEIVADSADPRVITEINRAGYNCHPSFKGPDSIRLGIDAIKRHKIHVTRRSTDLVKELRNYKYRMSHEGKYLNQPIDFWNHCIDATRYGLTRLLDYPTGKIRSTFTKRTHA